MSTTAEKTYIVFYAIYKQYTFGGERILEYDSKIVTIEPHSFGYYETAAEREIVVNHNLRTIQTKLPDTAQIINIICADINYLL